MHSFLENADYMSAGTYAYDNSIKYIARCDPSTIHKADEIFQKNYYQLCIRLLILVLRKILFNHKIKIAHIHLDKENFSGSVFRPVRSITGYSDSRIFDFDHHKVMNIFARKEVFYSTINHYEYFKKYFPIPPMLMKDEENLFIMEELIPFKQFNKWDENDYSYVIEELFYRYLEYFNDCKQNGNFYYKNSLSLYQSESEASEIQSFFKEINPCLLTMNFPCLKLHGDLWTANIMLLERATNQIYVIDWEYSNDYIFFYDIFHLIWLELYVNNNEFYLYKYIHGEMDIFFEGIFTLFDLTFQKEHRLDYLYIYFLNFHKERVVHLHKSERQHFIHRFKKTVESIKKEGTKHLYKKISQ
ncbi:phosphotransferase [Bacillus sp. FJAT-49736]|uniref:phosphotransferase n=1 Tax=Bacillus sp. FJAT-49736 TaxID=2833582 RepID=UPI001BC9B433|nr:phosphotransferase [Bacillus sp. FJAT-49736]MBS4172941.1 hypothetical protein [Bacillus sp. FJAT-49736]